MRSVLFTLILFFAIEASSEPAATLDVMASPSATVTPSASEAPLLPVEKKALQAQFKKTLGDEDRVEDHQEKVSLKEFSAAQSQQLKDWRNEEKRARETYFDSHLSGPDRRAYVQGYIARKKQFDQKQKDDYAQCKISLKDKHDVYKNDQKKREGEFKAALDRNERPARSLWTK